MPQVRLPHQPTIRTAAQIVAEAVAQEAFVAPRIEPQRRGDEQLELIEVCHLLDEVPDRHAAFDIDPRANIDADKAGDGFGSVQREVKGAQSTERHADDHQGRQAERVHQSTDIGGVGIDAVVKLIRPLRIAMPTLIERDASMVLRKRVADHVPGAAGLAVAMQEQYRPAGVLAPLDVVKRPPS